MSFKKATGSLAVILCFMAGPAFAQEITDSLGHLQFNMQASDPGAVLAAMLTDVKKVFAHYRPSLDDETTVVQPLRLSGTATNPILDLTVQKCVVIACATVHLNAVISVAEIAGSCDHSYLVTANLSHSSSILADMYSSLQVNICYKTSGTNANFKVVGSAVRADSYSEGLETSQVLEMLRRQIRPMTKAFQQALTDNGGTVARFIRAQPRLKL